MIDGEILFNLICSTELAKDVAQIIRYNIGDGMLYIAWRHIVFMIEILLYKKEI